MPPRLGWAGDRLRSFKDFPSPSVCTWRVESLRPARVFTLSGGASGYFPVSTPRAIGYGHDARP